MQYLEHPLEVGAVTMLLDRASGAPLCVTGCNDRHLRVWDAKSGDLLWKFSGGHHGWITSVTTSATGEWLATTCKDMGVRVFAVRPRKGWKASKRSSSELVPLVCRRPS